MAENEHADLLIAAARRLPTARRDELRLALDRLGEAAASRPGSPAQALIGRLREALGGDDGEEEVARDRRLVDKLAQAGRLRSGFLVRALKEGRLGLFEAGLARLGGFEAREVRLAVTSEDRPELLALVCAAVGIDQSVFPTILTLVRQLTGGRPGGMGQGEGRAMGAFGLLSADRAAKAFRRVAQSV